MSFAFTNVNTAQSTVDIAAQVADGGGNDNTPMPVHYNDFKLEKIEEKTFESGAMKLSFWLRIVGEKYANKVVFQDYFVIKKDGSQNQKAFEQINAMAHAMGVTEVVTTPEVLVGRKFAGKVQIKKSDNPQYPDTNEINPFEYHPVGYRGKGAQGSAAVSGNSFGAPASGFGSAPQQGNAFGQPAPQQNQFGQAPAQAQPAFTQQAEQPAQPAFASQPQEPAQPAQTAGSFAAPTEGSAPAFAQANKQG